MSVLERCLSCRQLNKGSTCKEDVRTSSTCRCPFYLGVHLIEISVEGESSILIITEAYDYGQVINMNNVNSNISGAPNGNFRENICSEDDLRTRIFGTFVVKFLACLPLLGFSSIYKMV